MAVNFAKQYSQAGLAKEFLCFGAASTLLEEDVLRGAGMQQLRNDQCIELER